VTSMKPPNLAGPMEARWASFYAGLEDLRAFWRFLRCLLIRGLLTTFRVLPEGASIGLGAWLGRRAYWALTRYRNETIENLAGAFPEMPASWIREVAARSFEELGANVAYAARIAAKGRQGIAQEPRVRGFENLRSAVERGAGLVVVSGHLGCWELLPAYLAALDLDVSVVAERLAGRGEHELLRAERCKVGVGQIGSGFSELRGALRALRRGGVVVCPYDQDAGEGGHYVSFFGRAAFVPSLPLRLARLSGAVVLPAYASRQDGEHVLTFEDPIEVVPDEDMSRLATRCAARLEEWIRVRPEQWPWFHERWRRTSSL
jgi:KDO2-lipid IV(A) lauroyltransferase